MDKVFSRYFSVVYNKKESVALQVASKIKECYLKPETIRICNIKAQVKYITGKLKVLVVNFYYIVYMYVFWKYYIC